MIDRIPSPFAWDEENDRPAIHLEDEAAADGISMRAFGADDEVANTMFIIFAGDKHLVTKRPEPLLVEFVEDIVEHEAFTLEVEGHGEWEVTLNEDQKDKLSKVVEALEEGLDDAPLGP
jgi:hypothetical protein